MAHFYFSYGMNTNPEAMKLRTGNAVPLGSALLKNYKLRFAVYADVVPDTTSEVYGVLWRIDDDALVALDIREGYPEFYNRKTVKVRCNNESYDAIVYFMTPGARSELPTNGYLNTIIDGYTAFKVPTNQVYQALNVFERFRQE